MPPWDKYAQTSDPVIAPADPYKQAAEQRAQQDQTLQAEAAAREAERLRMAREDQERQNRTEVREQRKDALGTESERTAGYLSGRIVDAVNRLAPVAKTNPSAMKPEIGAEIARNIPLVGGDTAANLVSSADRQQIRAAQLDILDAALTLGTGAAYTKEQLAGYAQSYFPQIGDDPATVESKRQALRTLLGRAAGKAGVSAPDIEQAIAALDAIPEIGEQAQSDFTEEELASGLTGSVSDETPNDPNGGSDGSPIQTSLDPRYYNPTGGQGLFDLAKQGVSLGLSDEAAGIGGALSTIFTGGDALEAYRRDRDLERENLRQARDAHPIAGTAAEFLGGGAAARVGQGANALANVVRQGAGIGAVGGFGYGEGAQGSTVNALVGAGGGAALGYGASRLGTALQARRSAPIDTSVIEAGQRQNVPVRQYEANPNLRNKASAVETSEFGGPAMREARAVDVARMEERVSEVGGGGNPSDPFALGSRVQGAGQRYIARTRDQANRLYDRARQEAGGTTVQPSETLAAIDRNIAELTANGEQTNATQIRYLEDLKKDFSRALSIESLQGLRTNMRGQISERGLTGTDADRRVGQIIDAANMDLARDLPQGATTALRAADDFYRERQTFINDTLKQFMGSKGSPLPAETAASRLVSMTKGKGNFERFSSMWKQLEPEEQADVAATVASSLGRKANGEFSVGTLIRSLDPNQGINPRTARLIFGNDGAQALNDLRILAQAKTEAQAAMNNSRTGVTVNKAAGGLKTLLASALGFGAAGPGGAAAGAVGREFISRWGEQRAARALLNPDFTKWLRNAPNTSNPKAIDRYFSRLSGILAANDNKAFSDALISVARNSPSGVAAQGNNDTRREPVQ